VPNVLISTGELLSDQPHDPIKQSDNTDQSKKNTKQDRTPFDNVKMEKAGVAGLVIDKSNKPRDARLAA
jgi:hypothetical protein